MKKASPVITTKLKQAKKPKAFTHTRVIVVIATLLLGLLIDISPRSIPILRDFLAAPVPQLKYWGICLDRWNQNDNLRSMNRVFEKLNFEFVSDTHDYDIVWSIEGDAEAPYNKAKKFKKHQKVNHFEGNYILVVKNFMNNANRHTPYILPSYDMPEDREALEYYIENNPGVKFVKKNMHNRGVKVIDTKDINDKNQMEFFQVFLDKPFLVDGHAFDMGVFVLITSLDPLRIYKFDHEILLRFCPKKYHPFDANDVDKYVVQDGHKSVYEMKGFGEEYQKYSVTFKELFERHLREKGHDVEKLWAKVDDAIVTIVRTGEPVMLEWTKNENRSIHNHFELVRFDFMIDHKLDLFVMEVNMSPNMTPAEERFEENSKIYEPMIYSTVEMIGGGTPHEFMSRFTTDTTSITNKNLASSADVCIRHNCAENCDKSECQLCLPCLSSDMIYNIREAYREWKYQGEFVRVFPTANHWNDEETLEVLSEKNQLMTQWFKQMCEKNTKFC